MNKSEIIERLKNIAGYAVHTVGEDPFVMSLDDGIAVHEAIELLEKQEPLTDNEQAIDYLHETGWLQNHDRILTEHEQMYKRAFSVACELLIGANLFGTTEGTMFKEIMEKEGIVSSLGYEKYILDNLARLTGEDDAAD